MKRMSDEEIGIVKESNNCIYGKGKKMWDGSWELGWDGFYQVTCKLLLIGLCPKV